MPVTQTAQELQQSGFKGQSIEPLVALSFAVEGVHHRGKLRIADHGLRPCLARPSHPSRSDVYSTLRRLTL